MASPLTAALMGGGGENAAMFGMDPNVMAAAPDIQLGQALIQGGLSTAPASPWQALARVAQTGAGSYIKQGAISDLAKAYSGSAESMARVFDEVAGPGNITSQMLRSPDPVVRMQGMQMAQKAGLQVNEQNPVLAGAKAGAEAGAKAPYESGGEATFQGPNGPVQMPISAATRQQMQPGNAAGVPSGPPRVSTTPSPSAAIPPPRNTNTFQPGEKITGVDVQEQPATFDQRFNGLASTGEIASAKTSAEENAKNQAEFGDLLKPQGPIKSGPGGTEPIKTAAGTTIPALKEQGQIPTDPAELRQALPAWQKTVTDWNSAIGPSQQAEQRLQTIAGAFKQIESGSLQTNKAQVAATLKALGIPISDKLLTDPSQVQLALHENYVETLQQLKASQPRFSQMEFKALSQNKEHPDLQPGANLQMLAEDIGTLRQSRDLPSDFTAAKTSGWVNPQSFEQAWLKQNPLSGYVERAKKEIGPLKGMPGFTGANAGGQQNGSWTDPVTGKTYQIINGVPHQ